MTHIIDPIDPLQDLQKKGSEIMGWTCFHRIIASMDYLKLGALLLHFIGRCKKFVKFWFYLNHFVLNSFFLF